MVHTEMTGVAWAVPVKVNELGARLQSYLETKPSIDTLRLCNRFGKGNNVFVTSLPAEVLELIVQHVRWMDFESNLEQWTQNQRCCEGDCDPPEHFTEEDRVDLHSEVPSLSECPCEDAEQVKVCTNLDEYIIEEVSEWLEYHLENQSELHDLIQSLSLENTKRIFGLEPLFDIRKHTDEVEPPEYILFAYLVLPDSFSATSSWQPSIILDPEVLKSPTHESSLRFEVTMRTLQLNPFVHYCQFGRIERPAKLLDPCYYGDEMKKRNRDLEDSKWPKLLLLNGWSYS